MRPAASLLVRALEMTAGVNHLLVEPQCIEVIGNVIVIGDRGRVCWHADANQASGRDGPEWMM